MDDKRLAALRDALDNAQRFVEAAYAQLLFARQGVRSNDSIVALDHICYAMSVLEKFDSRECSRPSCVEARPGTMRVEEEFPPGLNAEDEHE